MFNLFSKSAKPIKPKTISGEYTGSHPELPNSFLKSELVASETGIDLYSVIGKEKNLEKHFDWSEIKGFDNQTSNSQREVSSRITATRAVAFGVASAAMKKKKFDTVFSIRNLLYTTTGNIEIILEKIYENQGGTMSDLASLEANSQIMLSNKFKKIINKKISEQ